VPRPLPQKCLTITCQQAHVPPFSSASRGGRGGAHPPAEKMEYAVVASESQHVPDCARSQVLEGGLHWIQVKSTLSPMAVFITPMPTQMQSLV
jgi:hypothetical protein